MECNVFLVLTSLGSCGGYSYFPIDFGGSANWTRDTQVAFAQAYLIELCVVSHIVQNVEYWIVI